MKTNMFEYYKISKKSYLSNCSLKPDSNVFFSAINRERSAVFEHENGTSSMPKTGDLTGLNSAIAS